MLGNDVIWSLPSLTEPPYLRICLLCLPTVQRVQKLPHVVLGQVPLGQMVPAALAHGSCSALHCREGVREAVPGGEGRRLSASAGGMLLASLLVMRIKL